MTQPTVLILTEDDSDIPWLEDLARGIALTLSRGADSHRAAGDHETANTLDQAAIRFDPLKVN